MIPAEGGRRLQVVVATPESTGAEGPTHTGDSIIVATTQEVEV